MASKLRYVGPGLLSSAALWLALSWSRIPERWAIHWSLDGRPDGFAHKRPLEVLLPLLIGGMVWLLLESIASMIERTGRVAELSRAAAVPLRLQAVGMAAIFALLAVIMPLYRPERPQAMVGVVLLLAFGTLLVGLGYFARVVTRMRRSGHPELEGWKGIVYRNPNDTRLFVPNLAGLGYTLNFARPAAFVVLAVLLIPAAVMVVVMAKLH